jgi:hypothetical protein
VRACWSAQRLRSSAALFLEPSNFQGGRLDMGVRFAGSCRARPPAGPAHASEKITLLKKHHEKAKNNA